MPEVFAITTQKGGEGKTTSTINIAASLVKHHDKKVLTIDLDQQGNLTQGLGLEIEPETTILEAMLKLCPHTPYPYQDNFHVIPADETFTSLELNINHPNFADLVAEVGQENLLKDYIEQECQEYDYVLLDCPPALNLITINALVAANKVLIPSKAHDFGVTGIKKVLNMMTKVTSRLNPDLELGGVFFTFHQEQFIISRETAAEVREVAQGHVFRSFIRQTLSLGEATSPSVRMDIFSYEEMNEKATNGSFDYENLTNEILGKEVTAKEYTPKEVPTEEPQDSTEEGTEQVEEAPTPSSDLASEFSAFLSKKK